MVARTRRPPGAFYVLVVVATLGGEPGARFSAQHGIGGADDAATPGARSGGGGG